jgi:hypothetical protein
MLVLIHIANLIIVWIKVPVEHPDNPLEKDVIRVLRRKCLIWIGFISLSSLILSQIGFKHLSVLIALSSASAILTLLIKNKAN